MALCLKRSLASEYRPECFRFFSIAGGLKLKTELKMQKNYICTTHLHDRS